MNWPTLTEAVTELALGEALTSEQLADRIYPNHAECQALWAELAVEAEQRLGDGNSPFRIPGDVGKQLEYLASMTEPRSSTFDKLIGLLKRHQEEKLSDIDRDKLQEAEGKLRAAFWGDEVTVVHFLLGSAEPRKIHPAQFDLSNDICFDLTSNAIRLKGKNPKDSLNWQPVFVDPTLFHRWVKNQQDTKVLIGKVSDEKACQRWLEDLMKKSLNVKTHTKFQARTEWCNKFKRDIGVKAFGRAWSNAIVATGAVMWGKAGAPRKSSR